jgi:hypothetical protein
VKIVLDEQSLTGLLRPGVSMEPTIQHQGDGPGRTRAPPPARLQSRTCPTGRLSRDNSGRHLQVTPDSPSAFSAIIKANGLNAPSSSEIRGIVARLSGVLFASTRRAAIASSCLRRCPLIVYPSPSSPLPLSSAGRYRRSHSPGMPLHTVVSMRPLARRLRSPSMKTSTSRSTLFCQPGCSCV